MKDTNAIPLLEQPLKNMESTSVIYGADRLKLSTHVDEILTELNVEWFIESGTLLGAWRNNKLLPNDDDFDMAIILDREQDIEQQLNDLNNAFNMKLDSKYKCRIITTYCHKLEIFEPKLGKYILPDPIYKGADFHNVTLDLQVYCKANEVIYPLYYLYETTLNIPMSDIYPIKKINLEGYLYNCPNNTKSVLEILYGYLGTDYLYNVNTRRYEKKDSTIK